MASGPVGASGFLQITRAGAPAGLDRFMDAEELGEDGFEVIEVEGVGAVRFGCGWVVVDFKKEAVNAGGYSGAGEDGDKFRLAAGDSVAC